MSLEPSIFSHLEKVVELVKQSGGMLHGVRRLVAQRGDAQLDKELADVQSMQTSIQAEANWIFASLGAAQMTGGYVKPTVAARDLELHPANLLNADAGHGRVLSMLRLEQPEEVMISGHHRDRVLQSLPLPELPPDQEVWTGSNIKPQCSLSAEELMRMQASLHRAGDRTQDLDDEDDLSDFDNAREQHRNVSMPEEGGIL